MTFKTAVQAFITGIGGDTAFTSQCAVNWNLLNVFVMGEVDGVNSLIRYNFPNGDLLMSRPIADYTVSPLGEPPIGMDLSGHLYLVAPGGNYGGVCEIEPGSLDQIGQFGTESSFANLPNGIPQTYDFAAIGGGAFGIDFDFMCSVSQGGISPHYFSGLYQVAFNGFFREWNDIGDSDSCVCVSSFQYNSLSYEIAYPNTLNDTQELVVFAVTCSGLGFWVPAEWPTQNATWLRNVIGTVAPGDVDSGWTKITCSGVVFDQTDNNLIVKAMGQVAASPQYYIVKLNALTADVMWKVAVNAVDSDPRQASRSSVKYGTFCHLGSGIVYTIDTRTGAYTTYTEGLAGVSGTNQCFSDTTGAIILSGSYENEGSDSPVPLNDTPDSFSGWMALYVTEAQSGPPPRGGAVTFTRTWGYYE